MSNTDFQNWVTNRFETNAAVYRSRLAWITRTVTTQCIGTLGLNEVQAAAMCELLRAVNPEPLGKYPQEATPEDKDWFTTCKKPDYRCMLMDAERKINKLMYANIKKH